MLSGPPVDGLSEMDDLTNLLRQLAADGRADQDRREIDQELRRQDDDRLKTQILEEMDRRTAAVSEVASGDTGERVGTATQCRGSKGSQLQWEFSRSWRGNRPAKEWCE